MNNLPSTTNQRLAALRQKASQSISHWKPDAGDMLAGIIKGGGTFQHPLYGEQRTMLVEQEDGTLTSVIITKYIGEGLRQQNATIGSLVCVTFHGQEKSKTGHTFNRYSLVVDNG